MNPVAVRKGKHMNRHEITAIAILFAVWSVITVAMPIYLLSHDWIGTAIGFYGFGMLLGAMSITAIKEMRQ